MVMATPQVSEKANTEGVDMTMQTQVRPGLDRAEVWLGALGGAFRRISDGSWALSVAKSP
jgi:hypothetical protein